MDDLDQHRTKRSEMHVHVPIFYRVITAIIVAMALLSLILPFAQLATQP